MIRLLNHAAPLVGHRVERQRAFRRGRVDRVDRGWCGPTPAIEQPSTALIAVALVSNDAIGPLAWPRVATPAP